MSDSHRSRAEAGVEPLAQEIEKNLLVQQAIISILRISLEPISLDEQMHRVLGLILNLPWLTVESKGCIYLADEKAKVLVRKAQIGIPEGTPTPCAQVPFGACLCGQAMNANTIVFTSCLDAGHTTTYPGISPHGHYCVPVYAGQRPLGLLNLYVREGHRQTPVEERFLGAVGDVLAGIIERQRTQERLREQLSLAAFGRDVGSAICQGGELPDMLRQCAEAMVRRLDAAFARIWTLNEADDVLELRASAGLYTHTDGAHQRVPVGQYKIGLIARERTPHLTNDVLADPRVHDREWARREGMVAFAGYPLLVEGRLVGVMAMFARHPLSEATLDAMASVAGQVAVGIERIQVRRVVYESEARRAAIVDSSEDAIIGKDLDGTIFSWNHGAERLYGYSAEEVLGKPVSILVPPDRPDELSAIMERLRRGERVDHYETVRVRKDGKRVEVWLSVSPVKDAAGQVVGASAIAHDLSERRELERQEGERQIARQIQQGLLPRTMPTLPGFKIGARSLTADEVGGDCFDFIPFKVQGQECLGVLVADASGHGIGSALLAAETRAYLRALALACTDVGALLTLSNQRLAGDLVTGDFVTLFLMQLDPHTRSLGYANAGAWPGYVLDRQGRTKALLASTGAPLGIDSAREFPTGPPTTLEPGDLVFLFTDGIVEAASQDGKLFGVERTLGIVGAHRHEAPDAILDALFDAVSDFSGRRLQDDITAVILQAEGVI